MLPYDQIPEDRRTIGDATGRIEDANGVLGVALAQWMARDDSQPDPHARRAADSAMTEIDAMLRELHVLRSRLIGEIRADDDARAERVDAMLAQMQAARAV